MSEANGIYETASRIAAVADSEAEFRTASGLMKQAADLGHPHAASAYGNMAMAGKGLERDLETAFSYWSMAALEYGEPECALKLGMACRDGEVFPQDMAGALAWFMLSRDLGLELAALDVDEVAFHIDDSERAEAFRRYDRLRANCVVLR